MHTAFLNRSSDDSHLIDIDFDIGWFDSPAVENRFRASALPLLTGAATPSQQNLAGKTGEALTEFCGTTTRDSKVN